jgi:hypothetical protein
VGDLNFMQGVSGENPMASDPGEDALLSNPYEGQESDYRAGIEALPRFNKYHLRIEEVRGQKSKDKGTPGLHFGVVVLHGPKGTVGKKAFLDIWLTPRRTERVKDEQTGTVSSVPLTGDKKVEAEKEFHLDLNRVAKRLGLATLRPTASSEEALNGWVQPAKGKEIIAAISPERSEEYGDRNRIPSLKSIGAPTDAVLDDNGKPTGKTLLDVAMEAIKKYDEAAAKKAGKGVGSTAGGFAAPAQPGSMFS